MKVESLKLKNKKRAGFTLIELLVVIAIIGILTLISASTYISSQRKGRDAQKKAEMDSIVKALQMYYNDFGEFPYPTLPWGGSLTDGSNYVYMAKLPQDNYLPEKGFVYEVSSDKKSYNLFADLENREDSQCLQDDMGKGVYIKSGKDYCYGLSSPNRRPEDPIN